MEGGRQGKQPTPKGDCAIFLPERKKEQANKQQGLNRSAAARQHQKNDQLFRLWKFITAKGKVNALWRVLSPREACKENIM